MAKDVISLDAMELMHDATMHISIKREREFKFRLWVAKQLIFLAARILNCNIEVETSIINPDEWDTFDARTIGH